MEEASKTAETTAKSGGIGCFGTFLIGVLVFLALGFGANAGIGFYLEECPDEDIIECIMSLGEEEPEPEGAVAAVGTYSFKDYSVIMTANIPLEGGDVTGSLTGACDGRVKGSFDGKNNGVISGKITGTCDPFFVKIPASADFSGTVNKDSKSVPISFEGRAPGMTHEGSMSLSY